MRRYQAVVEIECWAQDDIAHFQPNTVNARIVGTDYTVVGDNAESAIHMMFQFLLTGVLRHKADKAIPITILQEATDGEDDGAQAPLP